MNQSNQSKWTPIALSAFRIVVGFLVFCHGSSTLLGWPVEPYGGQTSVFWEWPSGIAGAIQLVGGLLVMVGFATRPAAFLASGSMAVAYFWKHQPDGLFPIGNDGDSPALFCWALFLLVFTGPGLLAVDNLLSRKRFVEPVPDVPAERVTV